MTVRPCPKPVASMRAEGIHASDAQAQTEGARVGKSAKGSPIFSSTYAIARGRHVPLEADAAFGIDTPRMLPPPPLDVLPVFEMTGAASTDELATAINALLANAIPSAGAVLLRNLPFESASVLKQLLQRCAELGDPADWKIMPSHTFWEDRQTLEGLEVAAVRPSAELIACHNELAFIPRGPRRFLLACLQDALEGGETLMARNADLTEVIPAELQAFVRDHGGVRYTRPFYDTTASGEKKTRMSWQEKCGLVDGQGREDAEKYFLAWGYAPSDISWEEDGTLVVSNAKRGFVKGKNSDKEEWYVHQVVQPEYVCAADGEPIPGELRREGDRRRWECVYAFKMRPGDVLVLDNMRVQHGRLTYKDGEKPRCLVTVLYE